MKKFVCIVLAIVMLLTLAVSACAESAAFSFTAPCGEIAEGEPYLYHGDGYVTKYSDNHTLQVRYYVVQCSADETNRIAAYCIDTGKTMGAHWIPANNQFYPIIFNTITAKRSYTIAGRANTNYASKYGLNSITIVGTICSYDD